MFKEVRMVVPKSLQKKGSDDWDTKVIPTFSLFSLP